MVSGWAWNDMVGLLWRMSGVVDGHRPVQDTIVGGGVLAVLGLGFLEESEVPGVLIVETACHPAARLQPVLLEGPHARFLLPGRAVCLALGTGDGGHRGMPPDRQ